MSPLTIGISTAVSLLIIASLVLTMLQQVRNVHSGAQWPIRDGTRVLATITDVQIKQDWKERERWERNPWDGSLVRQRTWQTYYDVTAQWVHSQTKQRYTFRSKVWSDDAANGAFDTIAESSSCLHLAWDSKIAGTRQFSLEGHLDVTTINAGGKQ